MMDYAHNLTDKKLKALENKIAKEYKQAAKTAEKKLQKYLDGFKEQDKEWQKMVSSGEKTKAEYLKWRKSKIGIGQRWKDVRDNLAQDMTNANKIAMSAVREHMPEVYALNHNFGTFEVEKQSMLNTSYALYDRQTVERLFRENPSLLPKPRVDIPKDLRWNRQKIQSALTQGLLLGESMGDIAARMQKVTDMNRVAAIRNARTAVTSAENGGRIDSYKRAEGMGIKMKKQWLATPDGRTRDSHRDVDGETVGINETFSNGLDYPGDPGGPPEEVYNCRCTMVGVLDGVDHDSSGRFMRLPKGQSYEEWRREKSSSTKNSRTNSASIGGLMRPVRPRKNNFDNYDDFEKARAVYKKELEDYENKLNAVVNKTITDGEYNTEGTVKKWANKNNIEIENNVLSEIDLKTFNAVCPTLNDMFDRFPEVKGYNFEYFDGSIQKTSFKIGIENDGLLAANGGLRINPRNFSDASNGVRSGLESISEGYLVRGDGSFATLIRHEYGHNVQNYIETKMSDKYHMNVDNWRLNYKNFEDYKKAQTAYKTEREQYNKELLSLAGLNGSSEYSNTNTLELFAEGFAEYASGSKTEFGVEFGKFLKRWY